MSYIKTKVRDQVIIPGFRLLGLKYEKLSHPTVNVAALIHLAFGAKAIKFIQIGANDGIKNDHLNTLREQYTWQGVMIEANPSVYSKLKANHSTTPNLNLFNCAIGTSSGILPFYRVKPGYAVTGQELYLDQISSFDRSHIVRQLKKMSVSDSEIDAVVEDIPVQTLTYSDFINSHNIGYVDLLLVDTEGYDWQIIKQLEKIENRPRMIIFECEHLSIAEVKSIPTTLTEWGYSFYRLQGDIVCLKW